MTWLAIVLAVALGGGIVLFVWAMGAPGRRRPDREPESEKQVPRSAQPHNDPRQAVTPVHARHNVQHRRDGMEIERDIAKDLGLSRELGFEKDAPEDSSGKDAKQAP
jgi:hypothetical protein